MIATSCTPERTDLYREQQRLGFYLLQCEHFDCIPSPDVIALIIEDLETAYTRYRRLQPLWVIPKISANDFLQSSSAGTTMAEPSMCTDIAG